MKKALFASVLLAFAAAANATITLLPGSSPQRAKLGEAFAPIRARVTNDQGQPIVGRRVEYGYNVGEFEQAPDPLCGVEMLELVHCYSSALTDAEGVIELPPLKGKLAKSTPGSIFVAASNYPENYGVAYAEFTVDAIGPPKKLAIVSGTGQRAPVGQDLPQPFVARVTTLDGQPVAGAPVTFYAEDYQGGRFGGGNYYVTMNTDASGMAISGPFRDSLGVDAGRVRVWLTDPDSGQRVEGGNFEYRTTTADGREGLQLQDIWWSGLEENGWGFTIAQREDRLFPVLFAYDVNGNPTWQVYPNAWWYGRYEISRLQAYVPKGSPYFAYDAARFDLGFTRDDTRVTILSDQSLRLDILNVSPPFTVRQTKSISRHPFSRPQPSPLQGVGGIWWGGPTQAGWGISIIEHPGALFTVWYTYDAFGNPTWFVMPEGSWLDASTYAGTLYKTHSSAWFDTTYDPSRLQVTAVGTYRLRFEARDRATFEWAAEGHTGSVPITPLEF